MYTQPPPPEGQYPQGVYPEQQQQQQLQPQPDYYRSHVELPSDVFAESPAMPPPPRAAATAYYGREPRSGTIFVIIGIVLLLMGVGALIFLPITAKTPMQFEQWLNGHPGEGESIQVMGIVERQGKMDFGPLGAIYTYKFQGCSNCTFYGSRSIDDGSFMILNIEIHDSMPQVASEYKYDICMALGLPMLIIGVALLVLGMVWNRRRKAWLARAPRAMGGMAYPGAPPPQPQPQPFYPQQQYPPQYPPR